VTRSRFQLRAVIWLPNHWAQKLAGAIMHPLEVILRLFFWFFRNQLLTLAPCIYRDNLLWRLIIARFCRTDSSFVFCFVMTALTYIYLQIIHLT